MIADEKEGYLWAGQVHASAAQVNDNVSSRSREATKPVIPWTQDPKLDSAVTKTAYF
jgi:hypothetical protein